MWTWTDVIYVSLKKRWLKYFPAPKPRSKTTFIYTARERERIKKMVIVARGGMVVIKKKLGWDLLVSLNKSVGV